MKRYLPTIQHSPTRPSSQRRTSIFPCHCACRLSSGAMLPAEIIRKKRDGAALSAGEIQSFIGDYVARSIPDYQVSAWLMTVFYQGMTPDETAALTRTMMNSGRTYNLTSSRPIIDKHSTGGVGDKISLVLAPLAAACGLADPMVSGRGLGHTGGTLDKLESIPGFSTQLSADKFIRQVEELGVAMIGQSDDFVPADKKLYALRDVTATVESIPLICASILSKKAASGARGIVMDVKCGTGAFMATLENARALAQGLTRTGAALDLPVRCVITDMNQPLGRAIGNANEVIESIETLQGAGPEDFRNLTLELTAEMILLGKLEFTNEAAMARATCHLDDGSALEIFRKMIEAQGGNAEVIDNFKLLPHAKQETEYLSPADGYFSVRNCREIGLAALSLGAGRKQSSDIVNPGVGLMAHARIGDTITKGQPLFTIQHDGTGLDECRAYLDSAIAITEVKPASPPLILERPE